METTPFVTKTVALADTSPLTVATANQETNNMDMDMGNVSPVGSTGTASFYFPAGSPSPTATSRNPRSRCQGSGCDAQEDGAPRRL